MMASRRAPVVTGPHWTLFFNGSSQKQGAGAGVQLLTLTGEQFKYTLHLDFKATNNMVEYEALIFRLSTALPLGVRHLLVKGDSQLIIKQVKGEYNCNDPQLAAYSLHPQVAAAGPVSNAPLGGPPSISYNKW
jgi:ribonuclease HI